MIAQGRILAILLTIRKELRVQARSRSERSRIQGGLAGRLPLGRLRRAFVGCVFDVRRFPAGDDSVHISL